MSTVQFLAFESPWPAYSGAQKRVLGLLVELARAYRVDLRLLVRTPLTRAQEEELGRYAERINPIPRRDLCLRDRLLVAGRAILTRIPYHTALVEHSLAADSRLHSVRPKASDAVYANLLHWTFPLRQHRGPRWILDQQNADVHFWEGYVRHSADPFVRLAAVVNGRLTRAHCKRVYPRLARIISVCEEDRGLTRAISRGAQVEVIYNGVDTEHFAPAREARRDSTLLFTGTSAARNLKALQYFTREVYPLVRDQVPDVSLVIGGDFDSRAQGEFTAIPGLSFTGRLPDLRPLYNRSAVFVSPFHGGYGSKLKISEALAMGICIVSSPEGVRGMPVVDGESVLIGRDGPHMARQIVRALADPELADRVGCNARRVAETHLDWYRVLGPRLRGIVGEVVSPESG